MGASERQWARGLLPAGRHAEWPARGVTHTRSDRRADGEQAGLRAWAAGQTRPQNAGRGPALPETGPFTSLSLKIK